MHLRFLQCATFALSVFFLAATPAFSADSLEGGIGELAQQIVDKSRAESKRSIAVAPFRHGDGSLSVLSNYMVDELVLRLFSIPGADLRIVERSQLEQMLQELKLNQTGLVDVESAKRLGKVHGVDALIVGSITAIGETVRVIARMISTETGQVFSAAATTVPKTSTIQALSQQKIALARVTTGTTGAATAAATSPPKTTQVGPLQVSFNRVVVAPDSEIRVLFSLTNSGSDPAKLQRYLGASPTLHDDYGNNFKYDGGPLTNGITINPKKTAELVVYFNIPSRTKQIGKTFGVTVPFILNGKKEHSFSFTQMQAHRIK